MVCCYADLNLTTQLCDEAVRAVALFAATEQLQALSVFLSVKQTCECCACFLVWTECDIPGAGRG